MAKQHGVVREFDSIKGRGVIETEGGDRFAVRYSAIQGQGVRALRCGDLVSFEPDQKPGTANTVRVLTPAR